MATSKAVAGSTSAHRALRSTDVHATEALEVTIRRQISVASPLAGTSDMREVEARARRRDADAVLALDVYVHRLRASIAAMVTTLDGLDVLAFTGGIGEHSSLVRGRAAEGLGFLGVAVDEALNSAADGDADISASPAPVRSVVVE